MLKTVFCSIILLTNTLFSLENNEYSNISSDDWYIGVGFDAINFGDTLSYESETYLAQLDNEFTTFTLGHVNLNKDRFEIFYKSGNLDMHDDNIQDEMYDLSLIGMSYSWAIQTLTSERFIPFFTLGIGFGSAEVEDSPTQYSAVDFHLGIGAHYYLVDQLDISVKLYNKSVSLTSDATERTTANTYGLSFTTNFHF